MPAQTDIFKTFPEFSKLTLMDKDAYNRLIADYPPISHISFPNLMTWWTTLDNCRISLLNGNLVIWCWFPGSEKDSGVSFMGTRKVDESICTIFDWQLRHGEPARLVHVPEFITSNMQYPELYGFQEERDHDECIISLETLATLSQLSARNRSRIRRFLAKCEGNKITLAELDLSSAHNKNMLLDLTTEWRRNGPMNALGTHEEDAIRVGISRALHLGLKNICSILMTRFMDLCSITLRRIVTMRLLILQSSAMHIRIFTSS